MFDNIFAINHVTVVYLLAYHAKRSFLNELQEY
jgi:hypothetical protein